MKKLFTLLTICFCILFVQNAFAQAKTTSKNDPSPNVVAEVKKDTAQIKQEEINAFVEQLLTTTTLKDFQQWCYKSMTAEKFDDFKQFYQAFLQRKFEEWAQQKRK